MMRTSPVVVLFVAAAAHADPPTDIYARLPIAAGPVPGAPGLVVRAAKDATHCGGFAVTVVAAKKAGIDPELLAVLTIDPPRGLDFTADRAGSVKQFESFIKAATVKTEDARTFYGKSSDRVVAAARTTQIFRRFAEVLARMYIPRDVRTGDFAKDKIEAYCEQLAIVVEPILDKADAAAEACRSAATAEGWWTAVCADSSGQRDAR